MSALRVTVSRPGQADAFTTVPSPTFDEAVERALLDFLRRLDPTVIRVTVNPAITRARILHVGGTMVEGFILLEKVR